MLQPLLARRVLLQSIVADSDDDNDDDDDEHDDGDDDHDYDDALAARMYVE